MAFRVLDRPPRPMREPWKTRCYSRQDGFDLVLVPVTPLPFSLSNSERECAKDGCQKLLDPARLILRVLRPIFDLRRTGIDACAAWTLPEESTWEDFAETNRHPGEGSMVSLLLM